MTLFFAVFFGLAANRGSYFPVSLGKKHNLKPPCRSLMIQYEYLLPGTVEDKNVTDGSIGRENL